jgi:hypothetical protein
MPQHDQQQTESCHELGEPLRDAGSSMNRRLDERQREHRVRQYRSRTTTKDLYSGVRTGIAPRQCTAKRLDQGNCGIKVSPAHRSQERDQSGENRNRGAGICDERDS